MKSTNPTVAPFAPLSGRSAIKRNTGHLCVPDRLLSQLGLFPLRVAKRPMSNGKTAIGSSGRYAINMAYCNRPLGVGHTGN